MSELAVDCTKLRLTRCGCCCYCGCCYCCCTTQGTAAVMNIGDEDVMSGFATLLPGAEADEEDGAGGESPA
jgi:hypothetical protein